MRASLKKIIDNILFPIKALFVSEESISFLTSLRDERFQKVAVFCSGKVLDIGCGRGSLFINRFIGKENGIGIDVFEYEGVENVIKDLANLPYQDNSFDTVTLIAVGGYIPRNKREMEFSEFVRVLKSGGKLIMTEGERFTQLIGHKWRRFSLSLVGRVDMDSERGMEEEEYCMPYDEIVKYLNTSPLKLIHRKKFMWGLNNIYIAVKD
ncbi:MAG: class I SAM-dependent methyltransferase [Candidatus Paceibacterota bacterium]